VASAKTRTFSAQMFVARVVPCFNMETPVTPTLEAEPTRDPHKCVVGLG
jgi:hypothetical protein